MKTLIDLYPALLKEPISEDDPRRALFEAPRLLSGARPVPHPAFSSVSRAFVSSVKASPLTLLTGVTGVGKTRLATSVVERVNFFLAAPGRVPAVALVAPTSQTQRFSWKAFWERLLYALHDPLPEHKIHPESQALALRRRALGIRPTTTEARYFEMVCDAAKARGLVLLVIDEAVALARSAKGVTLLDQIAVLRELADTELFRIALVSTFDVLPHLTRAGVLDRRLSMVVFPRYAEVLAEERVLDVSDPGFKAFARSAHTFMKRLPEASRHAFSPEEFVELYRGSLGCVGLLCDWYLRAIAHCIEAGQHQLSWEHFKATPLHVKTRANIILEARRAEAVLADLSDRRLDLTEAELLEIAELEAGTRGTAPCSASTSAAVAPPKSRRRKRRRRGRPGSGWPVRGRSRRWVP